MGRTKRHLSKNKDANRDIDAFLSGVTFANIERKSSHGKLCGVGRDYMRLLIVVVFFLCTYSLSTIMNTPFKNTDSALLKSKYSKHNIKRLSKKVRDLKRKIRVLKRQIAPENSVQSDSNVKALQEMIQDVRKEKKRLGGDGKRKERSADKEAEHILSHKVEIPKQPENHMRPVSPETAPPDPEPSPVKAGPKKNLALAALDFGEPGKPGPDGVKVKLGGQGGKLRSFNTACFTSDKYRFTLVHVHKNGGSALADNIRRIICSHHNLDIDLKLSGHYKTCSLNLWRTGCQNLGKKDYFDFTFSRNPWSRYVSMWSYTLKRKQLKTKDLEKRKALSESYCKFKEFVRNPKKCPAFHAENQWKSMFTLAKEPLLNFIGRLEYFERDFNAVLQRFSNELYATYKKLGFEMANDSAHKHYTKYYTDPEMIQIVRTRYAIDCQLLGYKFEVGGNLGNFKPDTYHDGKPAGELNYGHV